MHWSYPRALENTGQDVLGVRLVDQRLETALTPGVTSISPRIRYYSLLAWGLKQFWNIYQKNGTVEVSSKIFNQHFRRLNLAIILSTRLDAPNITRLIGIKALNNKMPAPGTEVDLDKLDQQCQPAQAMPVYLSPMQGADILRERKGQPFLTNRGDSLAKVMATMPGIPELGDILASGRIPADTLQHHASNWSLSALSRPQNKAERHALRDLIYGMSIPLSGRPKKLAQARSIIAALLLHHAQRDQSDILSSLHKKWNKDEILIFLKRHEWFYLLVPPCGDSQLHPRLRVTVEHWRCLQARRVLHAILEWMLKEALGFLPENIPMNRQTWLKSCMQGFPAPTLSWMKALGMANPDEQTLVSEWLAPLDNACAAEIAPALAIAYQQTIDETDTATFLQTAVALVAWLRRLTREEAHPTYRELAPPSVSLTAWGAMEDKWCQQGATVFQACIEFLNIWCLHQHRHNALRKLRGDMKCTLRFHEEDGLVWRSSLDLDPGMSVLRSSAILTHLVDLGLLNKDDTISEEGERHLDRLLNSDEVADG
jgi:hypothetical protein